ncbi:MAG: hypothetical protein ACRDGH_03375 [Candidatus Limnocylindria bacterium]
MSDFQTIADRVEIEALRGEFTDAAMIRDYHRLASLFTPDGALLAITGLADDVPLRWKKFRPTSDELVTEVPRRDPGCPECAGRPGTGPLQPLSTRSSRRALTGRGP